MAGLDGTAVEERGVYCAGGVAANAEEHLGPFSDNHLVLGITAGRGIAALTSMRLMGARSGATSEEVFAGRKKLIPAGRLGTPQEFASVVALLASERAGYVNGVSLTVDGGTTRSLL